MREVSFEVRTDRIDDLLDSLTPLLRQEPIAITRPNGERFYLLSADLFKAWSEPQLELALPMADPQASASWTTTSQVADALMEAEHLRVRNGEFSEASWHIMRNRLDRHILPALGHLKVSEVDRKAVAVLMKRLSEEKASATTQSQYLVIVRKMLKLAHQEKWLETVPDLPKVRVAHKPRSALTLGQYKAVLKTAKRLHRQQNMAPIIKTGTGERSRFWITPKYRQVPLDMYALIIFMVNSFVRPSDVKNLRHEHVEVVRGTHAYLRLQLPESKRHDRPIVSLQPAVRVYEMLQRARAATGQAGPEDWVFLPQEKNREHALNLFNFWFKWVLRESRLSLKDNHGQDRTLYCLRHTAITFRLLYGEGIDMLTLARNARTSVDMIETFYASTLTGEMNIGMLQSRRAQKNPGTGPGRNPPVLRVEETNDLPSC